jgi:hypothetical protein
MSKISKNKLIEGTEKFLVTLDDTKKKYTIKSHAKAMKSLDKETYFHLRRLLFNSGLIVREEWDEDKSDDDNQLFLTDSGISYVKAIKKNVGRFDLKNFNVKKPYDSQWVFNVDKKYAKENGILTINA